MQRPCLCERALCIKNLKDAQGSWKVKRMEDFKMQKMQRGFMKSS